MRLGSLGLVLALCLLGCLAAADEMMVEVPGSDEDFVSLINEVVKKATLLRVKRNNAGLSDVSANGNEKEVDNEMAAAGKSSKDCVHKATSCSAKASKCKAPLSACDEAVQACVTAANQCHLHGAMGDTTKVKKVDYDEASPSSVYESKPEVLDEDYDKAELEKQEEHNPENGAVETAEDEAVASESAKIDHPNTELAYETFLDETEPSQEQDTKAQPTEEEPEEEDNGTLDDEPDVLDEDYDPSKLQAEEHPKHNKLETLKTFVDEHSSEDDSEEKAAESEVVTINQPSSDLDDSESYVF